MDKIEDKELNGRTTTAKGNEGMCLHFFLLYNLNTNNQFCLFTFFSDSDDDDDVRNELSLTVKLQRELKQAVKELIAQQHQQQKHRKVSRNFF